MLAATGLLDGAPTEFETCRDVSFGGVLCALPSLAANGLLEHIDQFFSSLKGYYTTLQILILLAYMALCRIRTVEQLQYESPGELGKLLGLDRVPEVRCMRKKLTALSVSDSVEQWARQLSRDWLESSPELAGTLYVDGHVRLYHGSQTKLPRRFISRQRLCLRGTTDYWINDAIGQPFFVVERTVDHGLLEVLRNDVVGRLLKDVPNLPTQEQLNQEPYRARFTIVFDREAYSPCFFKEMWETHRVSCITYHKYPKDLWPLEEFIQTQVRMPKGEQVSMKLAERGTWIGSKQDGLWVREVRKLTSSGHQTSLISTAYAQLAPENAAAIFSRWSQENFFRYAMKHFGIDLLSEYGTEEISGTNKPVVNPQWRTLDAQRRSLKSKLTHRQARYGALSLHPAEDEGKIVKWELNKAQLVEEIEQLENDLEALQQKLKDTAHHLSWEDLPEADKFTRLAPVRKRLMDTVRMIAYRAETAMTSIVRENMARDDDARTLLCDLFRSEADITPELENNTLHISVHPMANPRHNRALEHLLEKLNEAQFVYPGTNLTLQYKLIA